MAEIAPSAYTILHVRMYRFVLITYQLKQAEPKNPNSWGKADARPLKAWTQ